MNADIPTAANVRAALRGGGSRPDLSNATVREDLARAGRCAMVHLPTGRTCLLPLRHQGPCEFHGAQDAEDVVSGGSQPLNDGGNGLNARTSGVDSPPHREDD